MYELRHNDEGTDLILTGAWTPEAREVILSGLADRLIVSTSHGFPGGDLGFLRGLPLKRIFLIDRAQRDLEPLNGLGETLTELRVQAHPSATIELENLRGVTLLEAAWSQVRGSILYASSLRNLTLLAYTEATLEPLSGLANLEQLDMWEQPKVASLNGLAAFPWLATLAIRGSRRLSDILALSASPLPNLQELVLPNSRSIIDLSPAWDCTALTFLELSESGDIATLKGISRLSLLRELWLFGDTKIVDGDISQLMELRHLVDLRLVNRRHYKPSVSQVMQHIGDSD